MVGSDVFPTEIICPFFRGHSLVFRGVLKRNGYERPHEGSCFFFFGGGGELESQSACQVFLNLVIMSSVRGHECMGHRI